jgi:hypothetical protein
MKNLKEQKPDSEIVQAVDVELNEEQLDVVSGGVSIYPFPIIRIPTRPTEGPQ